MPKTTNRQPETMEIPACWLGEIIARHMQARPLAKGCCEPAVEAFEALRVAEGAINWAASRLGAVLDRMQNLEYQLGVVKMVLNKEQLKEFNRFVKKGHK